MIGCTKDANQPCREGTLRNSDGNCVAAATSGATAGEDTPDPTDDTGIPPTDDSGSPPVPDDTGDAPEPDAPVDPPPTPSWFSLAEATLVIEGGATGARVGRAVAGAGDIDGDGRADILVGADRAAGVDGVYQGGWATLHLSSTLPESGVVAVETADTRWLGVDDDELVGHNLGSGGDFDGDGHLDLLISGYHAPAGGHKKGTVYGFSGASITGGTHSIDSADWAIDGSRDVEGLGHGMSTAGDVDADGLSDVVMGGCCSFPPELGRAWIVTGHDLASGPIDLQTHTPRWEGEANDDQAGYKTSPAGDVDGDGLDDVAIGARLQGNEINGGGKVYIIFGSSMDGVEIGNLADADTHLPGTSIGGEQGYDIGPVGDWDGDGLDEVITGAYHSDRYAMVAGEALLYLGSSLSERSYILDTEADIRFMTHQENHLLGVSVEGNMDLDGNGTIDVVIGASGMAPPSRGDISEADMFGMDSPGDVYLYWGESLSLGVHDIEDAPVHMEGEERMDHVGIKVTSPGDVNADGADDLLVGTERGQYGVGRAYLLTGLRAP
jgi:hypothetical protein